MPASQKQLQRNKPSAGRPARVEPLAKLPIFWDLKGKSVLLAGNTDAVAWKAELIAACGANVQVYLNSAIPSPNLAAVAATQSAISLITDHWSVAELNTCVLALADCESDTEAASFYRAACSAGVPVNVIDKPDYCQFQFGSVVNRSPVVIAISTDGAAPILAQAIRRRIETLLPPSLKGWAALARRMRSEVAERLGTGTPRRVFWERFVDMAFRTGQSPTTNDERYLIDSIGKISALGESLGGNVTFVGAGPGEAEMLTLKAVRALQAADVIVYDDGMSPDVLELARREAKRLFVSECGEDHEALAKMTVSLVRCGKRVVRLVSGDASSCLVSGGEMEQLTRMGIKSDVVYGVSARFADADENTSADPEARIREQAASLR